MSVKEVSIEKKKFKKRNIIIYLAIIAFVYISTVTLINQRVQINQKQQKLDNLNNQIQIQEVQNNDIQKLYASSGNQNADYIEKIARETLDYAKPGERIFINISGE